jgi:hypothetical protein
MYSRPIRVENPDYVGTIHILFIDLVRNSSAAGFSVAG